MLVRHQRSYPVPVEVWHFGLAYVGLWRILGLYIDDTVKIMAKKPKKPEAKRFKKLVVLDKAIAASEKTQADTKALSVASKEYEAATKALGAAMMKSHQAFERAVDAQPAGPSPVPIPYPVFKKLEKETKGAVKVSEKALRKQGAAQKKLQGVIDKQVKVLSPFAKSAGDEAATVKGLISSKVTAKADFTKFSMDVKFEGKSVIRHFDLAQKAYK